MKRMDDGSGEGTGGSGGGKTGAKGPSHAAPRHWIATAIFLLGLSSPISAADYEFGANYTADVLSNLSGGLDTGTGYIDNLDLNLAITFSDMPAGQTGGLFMRGLYNNSSAFSADFVGDIQVVSNIDAVEAWRVFEFWWEQRGNDWGVLAGLYDLNSEFDVTETGSLFVNSSHGIGAEIAQTGKNGPGIFPVSAFALRGVWHSESFTVRAVVMDAVPGDPADPASNEIDLDGDEGYLAVAELDVSVAESLRLWAGYWRYSEDFEQPFGAGAASVNDGWYMGAEQSVRLGSNSAAWFVRYGIADERINILQSYVGAGFVIDAPFPSRPHDAFGIAVASAQAGDGYRAALRLSGDGADSRETTWEVTYRAPLNDHVVLQPDLQYVQNPSASAAIGNAWVVGLRFVLTY